MGSEIRGVPRNHSLNSDAVKTAPESDPQVSSIGRYLAQQRVLRDISVDELAVLTKIPRRSIERLEAGAFDREPDGFARGFVRTVAEALGLDPDDAVTRLLSEPPDDDIEERGIPHLRTLSAAAIALVALGIVGATLWGLTAALRSDTTDATPLPDVVFRRDVIRELARHAARPDSEVSSAAGAAAEVSAGAAADAAD